MKKRIIATLCTCLLFSSFSVYAVENEISFENYKYTEDGVLTYAEGSAVDNFVILPGEINGTTITRVADNILSGAKYDMVIVEEPIEVIGNSAFENSDIGGIIFPYSIKFIGEKAFANCAKLDQVDFNTTDELDFGADCFANTGAIQFSAHCSSDFESLHEKIQSAKGDDNFSIDVTHSYDDYDTDIWQCTACGAYPGDGNDIDDPVGAPIFDDVQYGSWYYDSVAVANYFGIINGKGDGLFYPDDSMTLGEAVKIAACIYSLETGDEESFPQAYPWYKPYVDYCYAHNIIEEHISFNMEKNATRAEMAYLFSRADVEIQEINPDVPLTDIPDIYEITRFSKEILSLYRRGIAVGSDEKYTFHPDSEVKRSEAAAFIARIVNPSMRVELPKG